MTSSKLILNAPGIYYIENILTGKRYIGQAISLLKRKHVHFSNLKYSKHHNPHLQNSFVKYGGNNFSFGVLIYCESFLLTKYEQYFVDKYDSKELYNIREHCANSNKGLSYNIGKKRPMSEETKKKIGISNKGKLSPRKGKHLSDKTKKKISEAHKGKVFSEETKKRLSKSHKGKILPLEQRERMSSSQKEAWKIRKKKMDTLSQAIEKFDML
jgi:group I intron endonuclease